MTAGTFGSRVADEPFGIPGDDPLLPRLFPRLPGTVHWGLERTERILAALGAPHRAYPVLHVGGTNGKGSVARIWAGILRASGLRTGLYTSPHLVSFRERILVDGRPLPDARLEEWAVDLRPLLLRESPSFFEAATALAFLAFERARVEVAVVEVGMGGRLDATNVVEPVLAAVTHVALDHEAMLGPDIRSIAREKAGIFKPGVPVFTAADDPEALEVLADEAASLGTVLRRVSPPVGQVSLDGVRMELSSSRWGRLSLASPLVGRHQLRNLALAVRALEALPPRIPVTRGAVLEGVLRTRIPGRFQVESEAGATWILDVAHNPDAAAALARTLDEVHLPRPRVALVGIPGDKRWPEVLGALAPAVDRFLLTVPDSAPGGRRWDPEAAGRVVQDRPVEVIPQFGEALERARTCGSEGATVLVTGSSHTVGDALRGLGRPPAEALPPSFETG